MHNWLSNEEWSALQLSVRVAIVAVLGSLPLGVATAYLLARGRFVGKTGLEVLVNLPLVLPPVVTGYLLLVCFGRQGWLGGWLESTFGWRISFSWWGAALASAVVSFPLMVRAMRLAFQAVDPRLEAAARTLGANPWRVFWTVSFPLAYRGVIGGTVLAFARSLSEFGATIMIAGNIAGRTRTLPLAIYSLAHRIDGLERCWRLVLISIVLACLAVGISEWLERRQERHDVA